MTRSICFGQGAASLELLETRICLAGMPVSSTADFSFPGLAFKPPIQSVAGPTSLLASADFNGDHFPDLIAADRGKDGARLLIGRGDGHFSLPPLAVVPPAGPAVTAVATGDFNGDHIPDAVFANDASSTNGTLTLLLGPYFLSGAQTFWVGARPTSLAVGDFNKDGNLDVMVGHGIQWSPQNTLAPARFGAGVLLGNGDGTFQGERQLPTLGPQTHVSAGDVNGDGVADAVFAGPNPLVLSPIGASLLYTVIGSNTGAFSVVQNAAFAGQLRGLAVGDLNRDGRADVAAVQTPAVSAAEAAASSESAAWTFLSSGDGKLVPVASVGTLMSDPAGTSIADFDLDGRPDVAVAGNSLLPTADVLPPGAVAVLRGVGGGKVAPPQLFRTFTVPAVQIVIDADSDRRPDIITGNANGVTALLNASRPIRPTPFVDASDGGISTADALSDLLAAD
jgi:hypothetical protein